MTASKVLKQALQTAGYNIWYLHIFQPFPELATVKEYNPLSLSSSASTLDS
jgi:hypothetical protein